MLHFFVTSTKLLIFPNGLLWWSIPLSVKWPKWLELTESEDDGMPRATKRKETDALLSGWWVKANQGYYTGNLRSALECWTLFPQFAKVYQRQRWAHTMAERLGGQVVPATAPGHGKATSA